jgi:hypothetical protein
MQPSLNGFFETLLSRLGDALWILLPGLVLLAAVLAGNSQTLRQAFSYLTAYHPAEDRPASSLEKLWSGFFFESNQLVRAFLLLFLTSSIVLGFILLCAAAIFVAQNPNQIFQLFPASSAGPATILGPAGFVLFLVGITGLGRIMAFIQGGGRGVSILQRIDLGGYLLLSFLCLILAAVSLTSGEENAFSYLMAFLIGSIALGVGFLFRLSELQA